MARSQDFWNTNKSIESEIDSLLKRLKQYDTDLEKSNKEIHELCSSLDNVEDNIRDLLVNKNDDSVQKAEPLFNQKQKYHEYLKLQISSRTKVKDEKIRLIQRIIEQIESLQVLRQDRLRDLVNVFGIDENTDSSVKISYFMDFANQLENVKRRFSQGFIIFLIFLIYFILISRGAGFIIKTKFRFSSLFKFRILSTSRSNKRTRLNRILITA